MAVAAAGGGSGEANQHPCRLAHLLLLPVLLLPVQASVAELKQLLVRPTGLPVERQRVIYGWVRTDTTPDSQRPFPRRLLPAGHL